MSQPSETRFTRAGDVDIAYQVVGPAAQLDLVFVPGRLSRLEVMWGLPEFARFLDRLAAMGGNRLQGKRGKGAHPLEELPNPSSLGAVSAPSETDPPSVRGF